MDLLTKQSIHIDLDEKEGTFSVDFIGCRLQDAYAVMKLIVTQMETGEFFDDNGVEVTDKDGQPVDKDEFMKIIQSQMKDVTDPEDDPLH